MNAIEITNLSKTYRSSSLKKIKALDQVSFKVGRGSIFGFLGPNGAGKTTLIKILVGLLNPESGSCKIMGLETHTRQAKLKLGYLAERPYYHDFLTGDEFLNFHGGLLGLTDQQIQQQIPLILKKVGLTKAREQKLKSYSKGMLQRIGIAQALLHDPEVVILDEPMSGLDPIGRKEVRDIILEIAAQQKTVFFSTHILPDVEAICSEVAFINAGKLKAIGTKEDLLIKAQSLEELFFTEPA